MKGIIIYKSKYGATKLYADWLSELARLPRVASDSFNTDSLPNYDYLLLGSSVYVGKLLIRNWIKHNLKSLLKKKIFLFVVCGTSLHEKVTLAKIARNNIPDEIRNNCEIFFLPGRLNKSILSLSDRILLRMGAAMTRDPNVKKNMMQDYNAVQKEALLPLLNATGRFTLTGGKKMPA
jgi:menaquinone-dependent protoporphyrinogen IX oxidase